MSNEGVIRIGVAGRRGSGKSFAARVIADYCELYYPGAVLVVPFAESLKKCAAMMCGISMEDALLDQTKEREVEKLCTSAMTPDVLDTLFVCEPSRIMEAIARDSHLITSRLPCTFGLVLQLLGTEIFRNADPEIFVRTVTERVRPGVRVLVIPDVRFENECAAITSHGGRVFRIDPVFQLLDATGRDPSHASEQVLTCVKDVIENDYTDKFTTDVLAWARVYRLENE